MGTANHTPVIPMNCGIINKPIIIKPNVLRKEIKADSLPLDNAVKIADENILKPKKRKLNANIHKNRYCNFIYRFIRPSK